MRSARLVSRWGFTLVEIMLVVVIIGVLAAMVVPRFAGRRKQAETSRAKSDLAAIGLAIDMYELDMGTYPKDLKELIDKPAGQDAWNGPYLKRGLPVDPWRHPYEYKFPSDHADKGQDYDLVSLGPDGKEGQDDLTYWESPSSGAQ